MASFQSKTPSQIHIPFVFSLCISQSQTHTFWSRKSDPLNYGVFSKWNPNYGVSDFISQSQIHTSWTRESDPENSGVFSKQSAFTNPYSLIFSWCISQSQIHTFWSRESDLWKEVQCLHGQLGGHGSENVPLLPSCTVTLKQSVFVYHVRFKWLPRWLGLLPNLMTSTFPNIWLMCILPSLII
jgi:hypothetical protein